MRKKIFVGLVALLTLNAIGMNDQKTSTDIERLSPFFADIDQKNTNDSSSMKRSSSCPSGLKIDRLHFTKINKEGLPASVKVQNCNKKRTLTKSHSESELCTRRDVSVDMVARCRSTDSLFSFPTSNPIKRSFACTNLDSHDKSIVFFCIRHCKDKANLNNTAHSQDVFNQFDIRAFNPFEVYLLKMIGEVLKPSAVFGGSHSRHSITASLFGWPLISNPSLNEQNLDKLRGLPLPEVVKHPSFQKMIYNANYAISFNGESGNQVLLRLRNFINTEKEVFAGQNHVLIPLISSNCTLNWLVRLVTGNPNQKPMIIPNLGIFVFQFFPETGTVEYVVDPQRNLRIFELFEFLAFIFQCPAFRPFINLTPLSNAEAMVNYYNMLGNSSDNLHFIREFLNLLGTAGNANNNVIISNVRNMLSSQMPSPRS